MGILANGECMYNLIMFIFMSDIALFFTMFKYNISARSANNMICKYIHITYNRVREHGRTCTIFWGVIKEWIRLTSFTFRSPLDFEKKALQFGFCFL